MSLIDIQEYLSVKKKLDMRVTLYYSGIAGVLFFLFILFGGDFTAALIIGIVSFLFVFGLVYGILYMQTNKVSKKLGKIQVEGTYLIVTLMNEVGVLSFNQDRIRFKSLLAMANTKSIDIDINEDLFMGYGDFKRRKRDEIKYGVYTKCHITFRAMPHGQVHQFAFFDIGGLIDKVGTTISQFSQFNAEKYQ